MLNGILVIFKMIGLLICGSCLFVCFYFTVLLPSLRETFMEHALPVYLYSTWLCGVVGYLQSTKFLVICHNGPDSTCLHLSWQ